MWVEESQRTNTVQKRKAKKGGLFLLTGINLIAAGHALKLRNLLIIFINVAFKVGLEFNIFCCQGQGL